MVYISYLLIAMFVNRLVYEQYNSLNNKLLNAFVS